MHKNEPRRLRDLLDRLSRVIAAEEWGNHDLNPAQRSALGYLARANDLSRAPSNVADYLCTTRGTASQTLKALERKGFISQYRSERDKRSVRYEITEDGKAAFKGDSDLESALAALSKTEAEALSQTLGVAVRRVLKHRGFRSFGICKTCRYHERKEDGLFCALLKLSLAEKAADQLCHEHEFADE